MNCAYVCVIFPLLFLFYYFVLIEGKTFFFTYCFISLIKLENSANLSWKEKCTGKYLSFNLQ